MSSMTRQAAAVLVVLSCIALQNAEAASIASRTNNNDAVMQQQPQQTRGERENTTTEQQQDLFKEMLSEQDLRDLGVTREDSSHHVMDASNKEQQQQHRVLGSVDASQRHILSEYLVNHSEGTSTSTTEVKRAETKTRLGTFMNLDERATTGTPEAPVSKTLLDYKSLFEGDDGSDYNNHDKSRSRENDVREAERSSAVTNRQNMGRGQQRVNCRCEYPGEGVYGSTSAADTFSSSTSSSSSNSALMNQFGVFKKGDGTTNNVATRTSTIRNMFNWRRLGKTVSNDAPKFQTAAEQNSRHLGAFDTTNLRVVNGERVLPSNCWACANVQYRCPGESMNCPMWDMQCTTYGGGGGGGKQFDSNGGGGGNNYNSYGKGAGKRRGKGKGGGKSRGKGGKKRRDLLLTDDEEHEEFFFDEDMDEEFFEEDEDTAVHRSVLPPRGLRPPTTTGFSGRHLGIMSPRDGDVGPVFTISDNWKDIVGGVTSPKKTLTVGNDPAADSDQRFSSPKNLNSNNGGSALTLGDDLGSILNRMKAPNREDGFDRLDRDDFDVHGAGGSRGGGKRRKKGKGGKGNNYGNSGGGSNYDSGNNNNGGGCNTGNCGQFDTSSCRIVMLPANYPSCNRDIGPDCTAPMFLRMPPPPGCPPAVSPPFPFDIPVPSRKPSFSPELPPSPSSLPTTRTDGPVTFAPKAPPAPPPVVPTPPPTVSTPPPVSILIFH
jgi:hypothetical protein